MKLQRIIGERIRAARKSKGWSQHELAERMGSQRPNVTRLELGRVEPTLSFLRLATGALGISLSDVLRDVEADIATPDPAPPPAPTIYRRRVRGLSYSVAASSARGWWDGTHERRACVVEITPKALGRTAIPADTVTVSVLNGRAVGEYDLPPEVVEGVVRALMRGRMPTRRAA